jgi:hypothetical protein
MWMDKGKSADACREALKNVQDTGGFDCNTNTFLIVGTVIALIPVFLQLCNSSSLFTVVRFLLTGHFRCGHCCAPIPQPLGIRAKQATPRRAL